MHSTTFMEKDKYFIIKACAEKEKTNQQIEVHLHYLLKHVFFSREIIVIALLFYLQAV